MWRLIPGAMRASGWLNPTAVLKSLGLVGARNFPGWRERVVVLPMTEPAVSTLSLDRRRTIFGLGAPAHLE